MPTIGGEMDDSLYVDMPTPHKRKAERKPYPTPMKVLIKRAKEESQLRKAHPCRVLEHPPDNGLLVPELIDVAQRVHVGLVGHDIRTCTGPGSGSRSSTHVWRKGSVHDVVYFPKCYHLYDRAVKPRVVHNERSMVPRIPAISELCIQAGVDLKEYPTKRRTKPVYSIEGRIVDFDSTSEVVDSPEPCTYPMVATNLDEGATLMDISKRTMAEWFEMVNGTRKMMERYKVWTCGYCPEIQVGPKGHKVRMCKASKHQTRGGMHAWQEATVEGLVGPNYVWHVRDPRGPVLDNKLKRYYGKAPALVELCVQGGADVPDEYRSMMRLDVVPPDCDEVDLVA
ncbi:hypothetical protein V2J09_002219 [Rumex salicifolius]